MTHQSHSPSPFPLPSSRLAIAVLLLSLACSDEHLLPPAPAVHPMVARYVSFGNSITAGFQSGGINDSTQREAYAVLLAGQMRSTFVVPSLRMPGCPPPIDSLFAVPGPGRVGLGTTGSSCTLRADPDPTRPFVSNVAVPGAAVLDVIDNLDPDSRANPLTTLLLGGLTQFEAARRARPTFATVWIGNNDALASALAGGDTTRLTAPGVFASRYDELVDSLRALDLDGGVLIGVVQVGSVPFLSQGRAYAAAASDPALGGRLTVLPTCLAFRVIPGTSDTAWVSVPFDVGAPLVVRAASGDTATVDCARTEMVSTDEMAALVRTVTAYNLHIAEAAAALGWPFVDLDPTLAQLLRDPEAIRPFPAFPPDPAAVTAPFGTMLSRDGIHPSAAAHRVIAQVLIEVISASYGTAIPDLL